MCLGLMVATAGGDWAACSLHIAPVFLRQCHSSPKLVMPSDCLLQLVRLLRTCPELGLRSKTHPYEAVTHLWRTQYGFWCICSIHKVLSLFLVHQHRLQLETYMPSWLFV